MDNKERKFRKRVIFDVTLEEHYEIKRQAALRHIPIRIYILQAVERRIMEEKKYDRDDNNDMR